MKIQFKTTRIDGLPMYVAKNSNMFRVWQENGRYYLQIRTENGYRYPTYKSEGFSTLYDAQDWLNMMDWENATVDTISKKSVESKDEELEWAMEILGLAETSTPDVWETNITTEGTNNFRIVVSKFSDDLLHIDAYKNGKKLAQSSVGADTYDVDRLFRTVDSFMRRNKLNYIESCVFTKTEHRSAVTAAINTKDLTKGMVRCKSSNVWAYNMNIRDRKSPTGDMLMQFKGKNGGPGDIYIYYDVPVRLYRRLHTATSVGHFFWQYIRNAFSYSKLTGNKRGVLPNAIN